MKHPWAIVRLTHWQRSGLILIGAALGAIISFALVNPVSVSDSRVIPDVLKPGQRFTVSRYLSYTRPYCTELSINGSIVDSFGAVHFLDEHVVNAPVEGRVFSRDLRLPYKMPPGPASYRVFLTFECFPFFHLWPRIVQLPEVKFQIAEE